MFVKSSHLFGAAGLSAVLLLAVTGRSQGDDSVPQIAAARTIFVDSEHGQDDNDGLTEQKAWRSLEQVNSAELKPGDTVRFRCGGLWRGSLVPASGDERAPVTYTSFGEGAKPSILGSLPRSRPEDWVQVEENVWATLPMEYHLDREVLDLRQLRWRHHQEAGAHVVLKTIESSEGCITSLNCENSGQASNHVQLWGPELPVEAGSCLVMNFRARSSKPFRLQRMSIRQAGSPWTGFASAQPPDQEIGAEWQDLQAVFDVATTAQAGCLHMSLGGILPAGAEFEFQPRGLYLARRSVVDPLSVDVGNVVFDHGQACGWKRWSLEELTKPLDYFYDPTSWQVFLFSEANPATRYESIELAMKRHVISQGGAHHVVYDGLAVRYGAAHGFGGSNTHHLVIRNCDLCYIGGGHQTTRDDGTPVRYGNAIEFWSEAHDNLVEGCRIWEVYDAALTNQGRGPSSRQVDITYRNNVIWNCEYSFEYWNNPKTAFTKNIRFVNNTCVNAGKVWSHAQRPDQNGSHLMFYTNTAVTSGIEIKYNIFCNATQWGSRYTHGWDPLPEMDYNVWSSDAGVIVNWFGDKIETFQDYRRTTGLDVHSLQADPKFIDTASGDYRLAPDSPARSVRPDGEPVGAETLWNAPSPG